MAFKLPANGPWSRRIDYRSDRSPAVASRELHSLFRRVSLALLPEVLAGLILAAALASEVRIASMAGWATGLAMVALLRFILARLFLRSQVFAFDASRWWAAAVAGAALGGGIWGVLAFSSVPHVDSMVAIAAVSAGVVALNVHALAPIRSAFPVFLACMATPWIVQILSLPSAVASYEWLFVAFLAMSLGLFVALHHATRELIELRIKQTADNADARTVPHWDLATFTERRKERTLAGISADLPRVPRVQSPPAPPTSAQQGRSSGPDRRHATPAQTPNKPSMEPRSQVTAVSDAPPRRLLLVEDNPDNQLLAMHLLQKRGYVVAVANHGREALTMVEKQRFDLILMDIQMPEMGGLEATAAIRLREKSGQPRVPIIALTAHALPGDREICLSAGMDDYLTKPINRAKLFSVIEAHLTPRRQG